MKNQILGIVALGVLGACSTKTKDKEEIGRYVPIGTDVLDTKTGTIYGTHFNNDGMTCIFGEVNPINKKVTKTSGVIQDKK
jgi:hypothetical protein